MSRQIKKGFKFLLVGFFGLITLMLITLVAAKFYLTNERLKNYLQTFVHEQTGGDLSVAQLEFSITSGLKLGGVKFTPPLADLDPNFTAKIAGTPAFQAEQIDLTYTLAKLLILQLDINSAKIKNADLNLQEFQTFNNFSGIALYRAKKFPIKELAEDKPAEPMNLKATLEDLSPIAAIPFSVKLDDVGVENFHFKKTHFGASLLETLDIDLSATSLSSVSLQSIYGLSFDTTLTISKIANKDKEFNDIQAKLGLTVSTDFTQPSIKITRLTLTSPQGISSDITGFFDLSQADKNLIDTKVSCSASLDLVQMRTLVQPFVSDLIAVGKINLDNMQFKGLVDLDNPKKILTEKFFPEFSTSLDIKQLSIDYPSLRFRLKPLDLSTTLSAKPNTDSSRLAISSTIKSNGDGLEYIQRKTANTKPLQASIGSFSIDNSTKAFYPSIDIPEANLLVQIANFTVSSPLFSKISGDFELKTEGSLIADKQDSSIVVSAKSKELFTLDSKLRCSDKCTHLNNQTRIDLKSLSNILNIAKNVPSLTNSIGDIDLFGRLRLTSEVAMKIPDPKNFDAKEFLNKGALDFKITSNLEETRIKSASRGLLGKGINSAIKFSGNLSQQSLEMLNVIEAFNIATSKTETKTDTFAFEDFKNQIAIKNLFKEKINLDHPEKGSRTVLAVDVNFKNITPSTSWDRTLNKISFSASALQTDGKSIVLEGLTARVPDFGFNFDAKASADLKEDKTPERFELTLNSQIKHEGDENLTKEIMTKGAFKANLIAKSASMENIDVNGEILFDDFSTEVKNKQGDQILVSIENMNGNIPIQLAIPLKQEAPPKEPPATAKQEEKLSYEFDKFFYKERLNTVKESNLMAVANFPDVRTFKPGRKPLSIKHIAVKDLSLDNLEFDIELKSNWISLNQFMMTFLDGIIQGQTYVSFNPTPRRVKAAMHFTRLNTHKLIEKFPNLKNKTSQWSLFSDPYLDGTMHIEYDLKSRDLSGNLDITAIGREQLNMILYYVDPEQKNPSIRDIRKALLIGEVKLVSIPIKNGLMGLEVDVRLLKAPIPTPKLTRFPISQILENYTSSNTSKKL